MYFTANEVFHGKMVALIALGLLNQPRGIAYLKKMMNHDFAAKAISAWSQSEYFDAFVISNISDAAARGLAYSGDQANEKFVRDEYANLRARLTDPQSSKSLTDAERIEGTVTLNNYLGIIAESEVIREHGQVAWKDFTNLVLEKLNTDYYMAEMALIDTIESQVVKQKP
jgi:hypothetical protein